MNKYPHKDEFLAMSRDAQAVSMMTDWAWYHSPASKPELQDYWGENVAILGQQVVGHHPDADHLRRTLSEELDVHPDQLIIVWEGPSEFVFP